MGDETDSTFVVDEVDPAGVDCAHLRQTRNTGAQRRLDGVGLGQNQGDVALTFDGRLSQPALGDFLPEFVVGAAELRGAFLNPLLQLVPSLLQSPAVTSSAPRPIFLSQFPGSTV
jgi:hypothetical protein